MKYCTVKYPPVNKKNYYGSFFYSSFADDLIRIGNFKGMNIRKPKAIKTVPEHLQKPEADLRSIKEEHPDLQLLMVVFYNKSPDSHYG